ncbi:MULTISPECIES: flagellar export chaperone FliS [Ureibacillus]|uniref:Flagellar export chaperone FliS n=1 Tax=Ureibacillus thermophilus TaxID=367743 RepID=A0A4P6URV7_9BACL|nr:flagellar export chaperone FliS [Ureibacillus thermophilus]QBK25357.1 flagellar export chaperone FliS [Ureibacillus thermophilus]
MQKKSAHLAYQTSSISTLSPSEVTLRLLKLCLGCLKESKHMIEVNDIEGRNRKLKKAQDIIMELMNLLDLEQEASKALLTLYEYLHHSLVEANIHKDIYKITEVEKHLKKLQKAMEEAIKLKRAKMSFNDII